MNLLSWLDVERILAANTQNFVKLPLGISAIRAYDDMLEVNTSGDNEESACDFLRELFGNNWKPDTQRIQLAYSDDSFIDVAFCQDDAPNPSSIKPLWKDLGYLSPESTVLPKVPSVFSGNTKISAFHSFKGGVGRTTSLLTWLVALIKQFHKLQKSHRKKLRVLIVDADLEAPGLTYLFQRQDRPEVSWIQLLEASHYPPVNKEKVIGYFSEEIKRFTKVVGGVEVCMLPAYSEGEDRSSNMSQLMDISVRPEHLARELNNPWQCSNILHQLGSQLGADLVLVDLRAGVSELSSPLLFDPRVERFIVTTLAEQAVQGTEFILSRLSKIAENTEWQEMFGETTLDPSVIATFITEEFKQTDRYEESLRRLKSSYSTVSGRKNEENAADSLEILEGGFNSEMLHLGNWESALHSIEVANPLLSEAMMWAKEFLTVGVESDANESKSNLSALKKEAEALSKLSDKLVYAEKGASKHLLLTDPLRNLAQRHIKNMPLVVSIGAKGAGKTFNYIQLCRKKNWKAFLDEVNIDYDSSFSKRLDNTFILPHYSAANIVDEAADAVRQAREAFHEKAKTDPLFAQSKFTSKIKKALNKTIDWREFWERAFIELHGLDYKDVSDFETLNLWLKGKNLRTIAIIDGLEELFKSVGTVPAEASAIEGLLEIPNRLKEVADCSIGIIILVREDYIEAVTTQNLGQLVDRYKPYQLVWDADAFLRLVYWTCQQAGLSLAETPVEQMTGREISACLHQLWGLKLGKNNSREAYSVRWVYAALCDLRGRLQARDVVRFLKFSSEKTWTWTKQAWSDRVLPPQVIREAMTECSEQKVDEAQQEFAVLGDWIKKLAEVDVNLKQIPFAAVDVGLEFEHIKKLIELGIIYEDKKISASKRYYLPEAYRKGLNFTMAGGGRPKVQAMLKDSLGKLPVDI